MVRVDVRDVGADDLFVATGTLRFALMSGEAAGSARGDAAATAGGEAAAGPVPCVPLEGVRNDHYRGGLISGH